MRTTRKLAVNAMVLASAMVTVGCAGVPDGLQTVNGFELDRYLGTWYEVARLDHRFERGMTDVTATYGMRSDGGVSVVNRGYEVPKKDWNTATGKAYFTGDSDVGELKVSFFGPFYGGYNVIELDKENYQYSMVAGPSFDYLWILSRSPQLDMDVLSSLVDEAKSLGFPTDELIYVDHSR